MSREQSKAIRKAVSLLFASVILAVAPLPNAMVTEAYSVRATRRNFAQDVILMSIHSILTVTSVVVVVHFVAERSIELAAGWIRILSGILIGYNGR